MTTPVRPRVFVLVAAIAVDGGAACMRSPSDDSSTLGAPSPTSDAEPHPTSDAALGDAASLDAGVIGVDGNATSIVVDAGLGARLLLPVAPSTTNFMWPSLQTDFIDLKTNASCKGRLTLAMNHSTVCYTASDDSLKCAGKLFQTDFGSSFVPAGQVGVDEIALSLGQDFACVHRIDKKVYCFGQNDFGQLGTGDTDPRPTWTAWGGGADFEHMVADAQTTCALGASGTITCAGYSPAPAGGPYSRILMGGGGGVTGSNPSILRESVCVVTTSGSTCPGSSLVPGPSFPPGIVTAGSTAPPSLLPHPTRSDDCALTNDGVVTCARVPDLGAPPQVTWFRAFTRAGGIVALAMSPFPRGMCAVSENGALWCLGNNPTGRLGTGDFVDVAYAAQVQPPGSVKIGCP